MATSTKITGGKVLSGKTKRKRCANWAAQALRLAAATLRSSQRVLHNLSQRITKLGMKLIAAQDT